MPDRIQALRRARGWSQAVLAERAGVTRQLVGAVEAGRHTPNVAAALSLARALGCSVEDLFAEPGDGVRPVLGGPIAAGTPVATVRLGDALVAVPVADVVSASEAWPMADAWRTGEGIERLPGGGEDGIVVVGCDPLLGVVAGLVERTTAHRMVRVHGSSADALEALAAGRAHGAVVHGPPAALPDPPVAVRRWHLAEWRVGLASRSRTGPPSVDEIAERRPPIVRRAEGASSHAALVRAVRRAGGDGEIKGPIGRGHIDVARRVASAGPTAGVTMEPAALALDLRFVPLEEHRVELWIDRRWSDLPAVAAVVQVLGSAALVARGALLAGYDLAGAGAERG